MKTILPLAAALLASLTIPALAQDTPSLSLSTEVSGDASATMSSEPAADAAPTEGPLDAKITPDNSYASLISAINAN